MPITALSDFLIARVEEQVADLGGRLRQASSSPSKSLAARPGSTTALQAELAHHRLGVTGGDAFDIHLRHGQHDSAAGAPSALQGLGVKRRLMTGGLGNGLLGSGAVGVSPPLGRALIVAGAQEPLPLDPHGEIEKAGEDRRHVLATAFDQLFHQSLDSAILVFPNWFSKKMTKPRKISRPHTQAFNKVRYKGRNVIERMFGRLKDFRRVATRYDKNAENFLSALCLAVICYWI